MTDSLIDADALLAVDIGAINTRAILFDASVSGYRFVATGKATSTAGAPFFDVGEGVQRAIEELQETSGRKIFDDEGRLITPASAEGEGVDAVVATISAGQPIRVVVVGLLESVSLESAQHLAGSLYADILDTISMNDRRKIEDRIDVIMGNHPDVIIIAGGTDNGASKSVMKLIEAVGLACYLMPERRRPHVLFTGNEKVSESVSSSLGNYAKVTLAPNIRPTLEIEQSGPAQVQLRDIFRQVRKRDDLGLQELDSWASGRLMPTSSGFGRVIRFLSKVYDSKDKGVLGVDLGASSTMIASAYSGDLNHNVYTHLGMGRSVSNLLHYSSLPQISRWLPTAMTDEDIQDYIYQKALYPATLPETPEELYLEYALAREVLRTSLKGARKRFSNSMTAPIPGLMPWFEPIVASGSTLTQSPSLGQSLLTLLDSLEPTGITTLVLDQNNLFASLGAAAEVSPVLTVQVIESGSLLNLGTVISPVGNARAGSPILRVRVMDDSGEETHKLSVKQGTIEMIPLPMGKPVRLRLQPLHRFDIGMGGPGRGGSLRVVGGAMGLVIDARGRPLQLPSDPAARRQVLIQWRKAVKA